MQRICWVLWSVVAAESLTSHLRRALQAISEPVNPCFKMFSTVAGDIIQPVVQTTNEQQCSSRCMDHMECDGFTFTRSNHGCSLRRKLGEVSATTDDNVTGLKSCFVSGCFKAQAPAHGFGLLRKFNPVLQGVNECVSACVAEHGLCHAVAYDGTTCQLMFGEQDIEDNEGSKMVDMHCLFPGDYVQIGTDVSDKYLAKYKDVSVQIRAWTSCGGTAVNASCGGLFEPDNFRKPSIVSPGQPSRGYTYKLVKGSSASTIQIVVDEDGPSTIHGKPLGTDMAGLAFQSPGIDWKFYQRGGAVQLQQVNDPTKNLSVVGAHAYIRDKIGLWTIHVPLETDPAQCFVSNRRYANPAKTVPEITTTRKCVNICQGTAGCHAGVLGPAGDCAVFKAYDQSSSKSSGFVSFRMDCLFPNSEEYTVHQVPAYPVSLASAHLPSYGWSLQLSDDGALTAGEGASAAAVWSITPDEKASPHYYTMQVSMAGSPHNGKYVGKSDAGGVQLTTALSDAWKFTVDPSGSVFDFDALEGSAKLQLDGDKVSLGDMKQARWDLIKA
ncbi:MAG: hypothetical protein KVP17_003965 [Porospora cf. gigantea B]|uniref:uncharacterized protein n=1 Tax=Porospora cf. gigantea B TaxID=2853592 RepID=UPI0035717F40|nr:MAG: hypothetical protein KVP17_003965 [Porospora cf. gigantea B]